MSTTFAALGVPAPIVDVLKRRGITEPFPIQAQTIAQGLAGRDVCGQAPTGSGKTLAFGIPLVVDLTPGDKRRPSALVLAPTRELANQIAGELSALGAPLGVSVLAIYGGVGYEKQRPRLARGVDIVVACPGRLEDLLSSGALRLDGVERVVIDEADRMADMGFLPSVRRILDACAPKRQTLLFSATLEGSVGELQRRYQRDAVSCAIDDASLQPDIDHVVRSVSRDGRVATTAELVTHHGSTIVFCRTKRGADRLARQLADNGVSAAAIHGDRSQSQRARALAAFSSGRVEALVATDVAARGIHIDDVACVIHYDPPADDAAYLHRSGRTGRAGNTGVVVSIVLDAAQQKEANKRLAALGVQPATNVQAAAPSPAKTPAKTPASTAVKKPAETHGGFCHGDVKFFDQRRGFGFINHDNRDVFVHKSQVQGRIKQGQTVRFELGNGRRGDEAHKVSVLT